MKSLLLCCTLVFVFFACKKSDSDTDLGTNVSKTKTELLTEHQWKLTGYTKHNADKVLLSDEFSKIPLCVSDNVFEFRTDKSLHIFEKSNKCDPNDDDELNTLWTFVLNETSISFLGKSLYIHQLDANTLKIGEYDDLGDFYYMHTYSKI